MSDLNNGDIIAVSFGLVFLAYMAVSFLFGYLLGSIPFGLIITRLGGKGDIRAIGSGNIGTTNVLRTGSKKLAALTLLGDALKGTVAVLIVSWYAGPEFGLAAGLGAFLGHLFPVWLKFKGGKGVATYLGILLGLYWPGFIVCALIWVAAAFLFRYSSLSALLASLITPVLIYLLVAPDLALLCALMSALLWLKHRANILRLLRGEEPKIGQKSAPPPPGREAEPGGAT